MTNESVEKKVELILDVDEFLRNGRRVSINEDVQREISREDSEYLLNASGWGSEEAPYFP